MIVHNSATVFEWPVRVYWEDTDAGGIVFYANYLKFFERARTEWLRGRGLSQQALRDSTDCMFVVTDVQLTYHRPARLDDLLCVTAQVLQPRRASLLLQQRAWLMPAAGTSAALPHSVERSLLCEGTVRIGWVDAAHMRPQRMPAAVLQALTTPTESLTV